MPPHQSMASRPRACAAAVISRGFLPGAMVAPQVVVVERLQAAHPPG